MESMNRVMGAVFPLDTLTPVQAAFAAMNHLYKLLDLLTAVVEPGLGDMKI